MGQFGIGLDANGLPPVWPLVRWLTLLRVFLRGQLLSSWPLVMLLPWLSLLDPTFFVFPLLQRFSCNQFLIYVSNNVFTETTLQYCFSSQCRHAQQWQIQLQYSYLILFLNLASPCSLAFCNLILTFSDSVFMLSSPISQRCWYGPPPSTGLAPWVGC